MEIPKKFKLVGLTFKIKQLWKLNSKDDHWGSCSVATKTIKLKRNLNKEQKEITYLHEIVHAILDVTEYEELSKDEKFVERFSKALHQVITTSE